MQRPIVETRAQIIGRLLLLLLALPALGQTLVNNGAQIVVREQAVVVVNGDFQQQGSSAALELYDDATLQISGNVSIEGQVELRDGSLMQVTQNATIQPGATLVRHAPGNLQVHGTLDNRGTLTNSGTIEVGPP